LEDRLKVERNNYELLRGKYNLLEQTMKEERKELIDLRAQTQHSNEDMTSTVADMQQAVSCYVISCYTRELFSMK